MWRSSLTDRLLKEYNDCNLVEEIVIIDNDTSARNVDLTRYDKVVHIEEPENTFVNPAWNKGVELCKNEDIIISNDDILFDVSKYLSVISRSEVKWDLLGLYGGSFKKIRGRYGFSDCKIEPGSSLKAGWGCMFLCKKSKWKPIPSVYKIYAGDDWIVANQENVHQIHVDVEGHWGTTSESSDLVAIARKDSRKYHKG